MHIEIPVFQSGDLFDSRPLDKKIQRRQDDMLMLKNLSIAFSQCISSYIVSEVNEPKEITFARPRPKTQRQPYEKPGQKHKNQKTALKKIFETKKTQIAKLATFVNQKMYDIASSVIDQYKSISSEKSTKITKSKPTELKSQLNESNKNFLIQLLTETGLLKYYKGMDRTFPTLIIQAQKAYYGVKQFIKSQSVLLQSKSQMEIKRHIVQMKQDKIQLYDAMSEIISMKKRHREAALRFEKIHSFSQISHLKESQTEEFQKGSEIFEEDDYMILAETKDTKKQSNKPHSSSISEGLYFSEFSSHHFEPKNEQNSSEITYKLEETHTFIQNLISNIKFQNQSSDKNYQQKNDQWGRLKFY